jgi:hypothetical protein
MKLPVITLTPHGPDPDPLWDWGPVLANLVPTHA